MADRADLDDLERTEGSGIGGLHVVADRLAAEQQHRMLVESAAHGAISLGARRHVDEADAAELGAEARRQRHDVHGRHSLDLLQDSMTDNPVIIIRRSAVPGRRVTKKRKARRVRLKIQRRQ
jgi:hypothetical protein